MSDYGKAALITAAFHEERLDYRALFQQIQQAIKEAEDEKTAFLPPANRFSMVGFTTICAKSA